MAPDKEPFPSFLRKEKNRRPKYGMQYIHACVFARFQDLSGLVGEWEKKCDSLLIVEHPAEGKTKRIHCHFLIETSAGENWFRDKGKEVLKDYFKRGNYWIALRVQKGEHAGKLIERKATGVYILKKTLSPSFLKNFSQEEVESYRQGWVEKKDSSDTPGDSTEYYIDVVAKPIMTFDSLDRYVLHEFTRQEQYNQYTGDRARLSFLLDRVRTDTMRMFYMKTRRVPPAMMYKTVAGSAYLRVCEHWGYLGAGMDVLRNLWY